MNPHDDHYGTCLRCFAAEADGQGFEGMLCEDCAAPERARALPTDLVKAVRRNDQLPAAAGEER